MCFNFLKLKKKETSVRVKCISMEKKIKCFGENERSSLSQLFLFTPPIFCKACDDLKPF